ncbi:YybH family protein [Stratiformator vulcanicus]|uniref:YybH family protein n=1 Tax=Stratiformator vulcanicus TaxID=2527980 RepID=UPI0040476CFE
MRHAQEKRAIEAVIGRWCETLSARDLDGLMELYAEDFVLYDAIPPYVSRGLAAYRQNWEQCLPYFPDEFGFDIREKEIEISDGLAVVHFILNFTSPEENHPATQTWMRATSCLRKTDTGWKYFHDHVSVPFNPETMAAVTDYEPN